MTHISVLQRIIAVLLMLCGAAVQGWRSGLPAQKRPEWAVGVAYLFLCAGSTLFNAQF